MEIEVSDAESETENNEDSTIFDGTLFDVRNFHKSTANADEVPRALSLEQKKIVVKVRSYFQKTTNYCKTLGNKQRL